MSDKVNNSRVNTVHRKSYHSGMLAMYELFCDTADRYLSQYSDGDDPNRSDWDDKPLPDPVTPKGIVTRLDLLEKGLEDHVAKRPTLGTLPFFVHPEYIALTERIETIESYINLNFSIKDIVSERIDRLGDRVAELESGKEMPTIVAIDSAEQEPVSKVVYDNGHSVSVGVSRSDD